VYDISEQRSLVLCINQDQMQIEKVHFQPLYLLWMLSLWNGVVTNIDPVCQSFQEVLSLFKYLKTLFWTIVTKLIFKYGPHL
jgi:hypothetical protein